MCAFLGIPLFFSHLFAVLVDPHSFPPRRSSDLVSNTLRARRRFEFPTATMRHGWGPPLVAARRGPAPPSRSLEICLQRILVNLIYSNAPKIVARRRKKIIFLPQRSKRAKC